MLTVGLSIGNLMFSKMSKNLLFRVICGVVTWITIDKGNPIKIKKADDSPVCEEEDLCKM